MAISRIMSFKNNVEPRFMTRPHRLVSGRGTPYHSDLSFVNIFLSFFRMSTDAPVVGVPPSRWCSRSRRVRGRIRAYFPELRTGEVPRISLLAPVWKVRMGGELVSCQVKKTALRASSGRFTLPKTLCRGRYNDFSDSLSRQPITLHDEAATDLHLVLNPKLLMPLEAGLCLYQP
jgi:hypothetical protein